MEKAYLLTFYKNEADLKMDRDGFFIGVFSSIEKCMEIQTEYSEKIEGFRDCPEGVWKAVDKDYKGFPADFTPVSEESVLYFISAWNETEQGDVKDLLYSDFYPNKAMADGFMAVLRNDFPRKNWEVLEYTLDEAWWREGFLMTDTISVAVNRVTGNWFSLSFINLDGAVTIHNSKRYGNNAPNIFLEAVNELSEAENLAKVLRWEEETHSWIIILQKTGSVFDMEIWTGGNISTPSRVRMY